MNIKVPEYLDSIEEQLKNAHTPKPYEYNLIIDFYSKETKEFWIEYQNSHPYIVINFFDNTGHDYKLINGELFEIC